MPWSVREQEFFRLVDRRRLRPIGKNHVEKTLRQLTSFFSAALLREEAARRPALLQRVDPRARLVAVLLFLLSLSVARPLPALLAHALLPLVALALSRIRPAEFFRAGFLLAALFSLLIAAPATLNIVSGGSALVPLVSLERAWHIGPYVLPQVIGVSRIGLLSAATLLLRVLTSVAAVLWLTLATRWIDLVRSLRFLGVPAVFVQVMGMTVRYLHALLRQTEEVHLAKKSRAVCRARLSADQAWVGARLARAWERSFHLMEEVGEAMTARGFTGDAQFARGAPFGAREWIFLVGTTALCAAAHFA